MKIMKNPLGGLMRSTRDTIKYEDFLSPKVRNRINAFVFAILWGTWATLYWQLSPRSSLQEYVSEVAQYVFNRETTYQIVENRDELSKEAHDNWNKYFLEKWEVERLTGMIKTLEGENIDLKKYKEAMLLLGEGPEFFFQLIIEEKKKADRRKIVALRSEEFITEGSVCEKDERYYTTPYNAGIYKQVSDLRDEINTTLSERNAKILITKTCKWIHVRIEQKWKSSLGFHADSPMYKHRLTTEGMNAWVQDSLAQLSLVEKIESIFHEKKNSNGFISFTTEKIRKDWSVKVSISGIVLDTENNRDVKKTETFIVLKGSTKEVITEQINNASEIFFPKIQ